MSYRLGWVALLVFALPAWASAEPAWSLVRGRILWHRENLPEERDDLRVHPETRGIQGVVVSLLPAKAEEPLAIEAGLAKPPACPATFDVSLNRFEPRILAMRAGQTLKIVDHAKEANYITWRGIALDGEIVESPPRIPPDKRPLVFKDFKASRIPYDFQCLIHPAMSGRLAVFDHPYFAVTDANGDFSIPKVPAGPCRLLLWHEAFGRYAGDKRGMAVDVPADEALEVRWKWKEKGEP